MIAKGPRLNLSELYVHAWGFLSPEDCLALAFHVVYSLDAHMFELKARLQQRGFAELLEYLANLSKMQ